MGSSLLQKGDVQYALALKPQEGYEETVTVVTFHLLSTRTFEYIEDQKAIFNYQGTETDIAVPDNVDGMPVTQLWEKAFEEDAITSVVLPKNLSHLEAYDAQQETHGLLSGLEGLERVTIYKSTKGLPKGCIPAGVTICAPKGSEAEKYAKKHGHPFEPLK